VERPADTDTVDYYYTISDNEIYVYKDHQDRPETEEDIERREREREFERAGDELEEITERHFALRSEFVSSFGAAKRNALLIMKYAAGIIVGDGEYRPDDINAELLAELLDLDIDDDTDYPTLRAMVGAEIERNPEYTLLACAYASCDYDENEYWRREWSDGAYHHVYKANDKLDQLYDFLISLGYEMSDEEKAMRDGTHELLETSTRS
jgi:ParB family chromosome partitioning protein